MRGFTTFRLVTALARWAILLAKAPLRGFPIIITPPPLPLQIILTHHGPVRARIRSYFDWASLYEIFGSKEYDTKGFRHDEKLQAVYESMLKAGEVPLIIDGGCNVGFASLFFKMKYPKAVIIGVEPVVDNAELARRNLEGFQDVEVLTAAVSHSTGVLYVSDPGLGNNAFRTSVAAEGDHLSVPSLSIDDILAQRKDCKPFIMKLDIEGFEKSLFETNTSWVDKFDVIMVETHDWMLPGEAISRPLMKVLGEHDRDLIFKGENLFSVKNY